MGGERMKTQLIYLVTLPDGAMKAYEGFRGANSCVTRHGGDIKEITLRRYVKYGK